MDELEDRLLGELRGLFPDGRVVGWEVPPPSLQGRHARRGREGIASYRTLFALLRIAAPGRWLKLGPFSHPGKVGPLASGAKKHGLETAMRMVNPDSDGAMWLYLRAPAVLEDATDE